MCCPSCKKGMGFAGSEHAHGTGTRSSPRRSEAG
jgi:hypothetical protein